MPSRRTYIPKADGKQRPLGIAAIEDKIVQAAVVMILTPIYEAEFLGFSYGFRPGRSAHDAIQALWLWMAHADRYVLDADIRKCFDRIGHQALLTKLHTFPTMRRAVRAWLKAGVMDGATLFPTTEGTPQGGVALLLAPSCRSSSMRAWIRPRSKRLTAS